MASVFISHSSRLRPAEQLSRGDTPSRHAHRKRFLTSVVDALERRLLAMGLEVWVDRSRIAAGDEFEGAIHFGLTQCDIGIVLLDRDALGSEYVRKEATILMWRRRMGGTHVLPVLLADVDEERLRTSPLGNPVGLSSLSLLRSPSRRNNHKAVAPLVDAIAASVESKLPYQPDDSPEARWVEDFAHYTADIPRERLWRAAQALGIDRGDWNSASDPHELLAAAVLGADAERVFLALRQIVDLLDEERPKRRAVARAKPLWVDLDAAKHVGDIADLPARKRVFAVRTRALRLAEHVVERATCSAVEYGHLRLPDVGGEDWRAEQLERYDATLRALLNLSQRDLPDEIERTLGERQGAVFALIRCDALPAPETLKLLQALRDRFPGVVFVALADRKSKLWSKLKIPQPYRSLTSAKERDARVFVSQTASLIGEEILVDADD